MLFVVSVGNNQALLALGYLELFFSFVRLNFKCFVLLFKGIKMLLCRFFFEPRYWLFVNNDRCEGRVPAYSGDVMWISKCIAANT